MPLNDVLSLILLHKSSFLMISDVIVIVYIVICAIVSRLDCKLVLSWGLSRDLASHSSSLLALCLFLS